MSEAFDHISPREIGERLRIARDSAKLTQAAAASAADMARTTLVAIEQGQRRARYDELLRLVRLYGTTLNALLREEAVCIDLLPQFRKLSADSDPAVEEAAQLLNNLVSAETELESLLGIKRSRQYPPERPILAGDVRSQAEQDAIELRQWLGLGLAPITDIVTLLELQLGARVFVRRLDSKISGLFAFEERVGPCFLLNANHPKERRMLSGAHELGHFISTRHNADLFDENIREGARAERYANAFARAFLTPVRAVMQKFQEVTAGSPLLTRRHIIVLAHFFGVSREAMVRRLEELKLAKSGTWDWFEENGGITDAQARQVLGDADLTDIHRADFSQRISLRLGALAEEVWRQDLLSEGQLARLLHLNRVEFREFLDQLDSDGKEGR